MGFLDKAKAAAEQAASKANEAVEDVQTKRELTKAYGDLGQTAYRLAASGALTHSELAGQVGRIEELEAKLKEESEPPAGDGGGPTAAAPA